MRSRARLVLQTRGQAIAQSILRIGPAYEKNLIPVALDGLSDEAFGFAFSVHFCRIDQNQTEIDAFAQGADRAQDQDCSSRRKFRRPPDRFDAMPA